MSFMENHLKGPNASPSGTKQKGLYALMQFKSGTRKSELGANASTSYKKELINQQRTYISYNSTTLTEPHQKILQSS
jgi:hypothetical protein